MCVYISVHVYVHVESSGITAQDPAVHLGVQGIDFLLLEFLFYFVFEVRSLPRTWGLADLARLVPSKCQGSAYLCLLSGIKGVCHHTWLFLFFWHLVFNTDLALELRASASDSLMKLLAYMTNFTLRFHTSYLLKLKTVLNLRPLD